MKARRGSTRAYNGTLVYGRKYRHVFPMDEAPTLPLPPNTFLTLPARVNTGRSTITFKRKYFAPSILPHLQYSLGNLILNRISRGQSRRELTLRIINQSSR